MVKMSQGTATSQSGWVQVLVPRRNLPPWQYALLGTGEQKPARLLGTSGE